MHRLTIVFVAVAALAATLAGLAAADDPGTGRPQAAPAAAPQLPAPAPALRAAGPTRGATLTVRPSRFGEVLFDGRNRALYLFTRDGRGASRCYGACARAWPPFLTHGRPHARRGARAALLDTVRRRDGSRQVTYRGRPLYFYVGDGPGQILCQGVVEFGGRWLVVAGDGRAVS